jgi:hypothetical protein
MKSARGSVRLFPIIVIVHVLAQAALMAHAFAQSAATPGDSGAERSTSETSATPGFEAGVRFGAALPLGSAGRDADGADRKLSSLTSWRTPLWLDVAYRVSPRASYGLYGQLGVGGTGRGCSGECDFSDLRVGAQGLWRLTPERAIDPWLGLGVGWESLSYRSLSTDTGTSSTELLGGPELLLQGGVSLRVEDSLQLGPFVSAGVGNYIRDSYKCVPAGLECPVGTSVAGSGFHTWLGLGVNVRYSP